MFSLKIMLFRWKKQDWENFEIWTAENWDAIDWEEEFFEKLSLENWQAFLNYIGKSDGKVDTGYSL